MAKGICRPPGRRTLGLLSPAPFPPSVQLFSLQRLPVISQLPRCCAVLSCFSFFPLSSTMDSTAIPLSSRSRCSSIGALQGIASLAICRARGFGIALNTLAPLQHLCVQMYTPYSVFDLRLSCRVGQISSYTRASERRRTGALPRLEGSRVASRAGTTAPKFCEARIRGGGGSEVPGCLKTGAFDPHPLLLSPCKKASRVFFRVKANFYQYVTPQSKHS